MSLENFQILNKLGDGSYSSVYKVRRADDGHIYALKKVKIQNLSDREKENALNEVRILASVKNTFVAAYKEAFFDEPSSSLCIIMEFADDGDVFQRICECQNIKQFMKEKHIWKIVIQVVKGLQALHEMKILHRDMKSANIFLYKDQTAKLGDLNVSKVAKKGLLYTQTGTPYYASPEVWKDQPYDLKSDIWSLGCVIYEMCALVPPFRADDMNGLFKRVLKGQYPPIPSHYSMDMRMLIKALLQVNPTQRPTTEQVLDMPIVVKRIKKYFSARDGSISPALIDATKSQDAELLRTIKLSKNVFKLSLPASNYGQNANFATIPGTQVLKQAQQQSNSGHSASGKDLSSKPKKSLGVSNSKTTAVTNNSSKQTIGEVNLPNITNKRLAAIDDDNKDDYDDNVPQKPRNIKRTSSDEDDSGVQRIYRTKDSGSSAQRNNSVNPLPPTKSASDLGSIQGRNKGNSGKSNLPQVSGRSRKSPDDNDDAYNNKPTIDSKIKGLQGQRHGVNPSPSVHSLQEQNRRRSSKDSHNRDKSNNHPHDEYADEVKRITGPNKGSSKKMLPLQEQQALLANRINEKRIRGIGQSQSALDNPVDSRGNPLSSIHKHDSHPRMHASPSLKHLDQISVQGLQSSSKKRPQLNGQSHGVLAGSGGANGMQNGNNYIRIVNIYSVNNYKNKRKSHAPESRLHMNHAVLPTPGVQGKVGPYDDIRKHGGDGGIQLPEIRGGSQASVDYIGNRGGYHYKNGIDQQNNAMISKLMSRKKSYERMMKLDDGSQSPPPLQQRNPNIMQREVSAKKNQEVLLTANHSSNISRAQLGSQNKKGLQYYDSTPPNIPRKATKGKASLLALNTNTSSNVTPSNLEMTGKNLMPKTVESRE